MYSMDLILKRLFWLALIFVLLGCEQEFTRKDLIDLCENKNTEVYVQSYAQRFTELPKQCNIVENDHWKVYALQPEYPSEALTESIEGKVEVRFAVDKDGSVVDPEIIYSEPPNVFDEVTINAVKLWYFIPLSEQAKSAGSSGMKIVQPIDFNMKDYWNSRNFNNKPRAN